MKMYISGVVAHLKEDWTFAEVASSNIDSLAASLEQIGSGSEKNLRIDFEQMNEFDASGLQLLYIWLQCFRIRGVEPELINIPENMQKTFQIKGLPICC